MPALTPPVSRMYIEVPAAMTTPIPGARAAAVGPR
jgi:hypothetical protein